MNFLNEKIQGIILPLDFFQRQDDFFRYLRLL